MAPRRVVYCTISHSPRINETKNNPVRSGGGRPANRPTPRVASGRYAMGAMSKISFRVSITLLQALVVLIYRNRQIVSLVLNVMPGSSPGTAAQLSVNASCVM
jgi:hypothetical protein